MYSYKNTDGSYTIKPDEGTYLHNTRDDYYCLSANSSSSPKLTDWEQVDALPVTIKTDEEIFEEFRDEIFNLMTIQRGSQSSKSTVVTYTFSYDSTGIHIKENFI